MKNWIGTFRKPGPSMGCTPDLPGRPTVSRLVFWAEGRSIASSGTVQTSRPFLPGGVQPVHFPCSSIPGGGPSGNRIRPEPPMGSSLPRRRATFFSRLSVKSTFRNAPPVPCAASRTTIEVSSFTRHGVSMAPESCTPRGTIPDWAASGSIRFVPEAT